MPQANVGDQASCTIYLWVGTGSVPPAYYNARPNMSSPSWRPHPNLSDVINLRISLSEKAGGVYLRDLDKGRLLQIQTQHRNYFVTRLNNGETLIWGHPVYCPNPVAVRIAGSTWGGSLLKLGFVGQGMQLEFRHPDYSGPITTSRIRAVREIDCAPSKSCDRCLGWHLPAQSLNLN
jgi:hypothetical protein